MLDRRLIWAGLLVLLMAAESASGQDSWLITDHSAVDEGEPVWLSLVTGDVFPFSDVAMNPGAVVEFVDRSDQQVRPITDYARQDRGLSIRRSIQGRGIHVIGSALAPQTVRMSAAEFDDYLQRERATKAIALRSSHDRTGEIQETFTKFAKTLVEVRPSDNHETGYAAPLGHRLEIIPLSNPCRWRQGDHVEVEVRLDGYPWSDVALSAGHEGLEYPAYVVQTRTDAHGRAMILLDAPGHWFVKAHVIRCREAPGPPRWESFWATLSFRAAGEVDLTEAVRSLRAAHRTLKPWMAVSYERARLALGRLIRDVFVTTPTDRLAAAPSEIPRSPDTLRSASRNPKSTILSGR
jgi:uncharacterized GH25 family protein